MAESVRLTPSIIRSFKPLDLHKFNKVNLDPFTETYNFEFYMSYYVRHGDFFFIAEHLDGSIQGYIMGKAEGRGRDWHGHITAVSVAYDQRRQGIAQELIRRLEEVSESKRCYFVDLYVRVSNKTAIDMYKKLGYSVYQRIENYYSGQGEEDEDAFDMRKPLSRDPHHLCLISNNSRQQSNNGD